MFEDGKIIFISKTTAPKTSSLVKMSLAGLLQTAISADSCARITSCLARLNLTLNSE